MRPHPLILLPLLAPLAGATPDPSLESRFPFLGVDVNIDVDVDLATLKATAQTAKSCVKLAKLTAIESLAANETAIAAIAADDADDAAEIRAKAAKNGPELAALRAQAGGSLPQTCDTLKAEAACAAVRALKTANGKAEGAGVPNGTVNAVGAMVGAMAGADVQALMSTCSGEGPTLSQAQAQNGMSSDGQPAPVPLGTWILSLLTVAVGGALML